MRQNVNVDWGLSPIFRPALRADVFARCLSRHVSHASILHIVSSIWQTGSSETSSAFVESVRYYGKLRSFARFALTGVYPFFECGNAPHPSK